MIGAMDPLQRLDELASAAAPVDVADVLAYFDALPAVEVVEMLGSWEGGIVATGHPGESQLEGLRWAGKDFRGPEDVDPIVSYDDGGARVVNDVLGSARLRAVEYRGVVTATMAYDRHPILDHFRRVGDDVVLGVMDRKGDEQPLVFFLRRIAG
jgi:hypothetical protein